MSTSTRQRLLVAAKSVFLKNGFEESTVQMIAAEAGANIAAVNYHYGSKADLYAECVARHLEDSMSRMPRLSGKPDHPKDQLVGFIEWFYTRYQPDSPLRRLNEDLVSLKPTFIHSILETVIRPEFENCAELVTAILPSSATKTTVRCWVKNILSLCIGPLHGVKLHPLLFPDVSFDDTEIEHQCTHSIRMILDGLDAESKRLENE